MIKVFEDESYIEVKEGNSPDEAVISICGRDSTDPSIITILSVKMAWNELHKIVERPSKPQQKVEGEGVK